VALRSDVGKRTADLLAQIKSLAARVGDLDARVLKIEKRPIADAGGAVAAAVAAYEDELQTLRSKLDQQRARIEKLAADVTARLSSAQEQASALQESTVQTANETKAREALSRIRAALEDGGGFASALEDFNKAGNVKTREVLGKAAKEGVPTLAQLQASFPDAARAALAVSLRVTAGEGTMNKLGAFLKSQLGARSLKPHDGNDPDAVLSRAEAALKKGDLDVTLALIKALPDEGEAAMADWVHVAQTRSRALAAVAGLTRQLNQK